MALVTLPRPATPTTTAATTVRSRPVRRAPDPGSTATVGEPCGSLSGAEVVHRAAAFLAVLLVAVLVVVVAVAHTTGAGPAADGATTPIRIVIPAGS